MIVLQAHLNKAYVGDVRFTTIAIGIIITSKNSCGSVSGFISQKKKSVSGLKVNRIYDNNDFESYRKFKFCVGSKFNAITSK